MSSPLQLAIPTGPLPLAPSDDALKRQGTEFETSQVQQKHGQAQPHAFSCRPSLQPLQGLREPVFSLAWGMDLGLAQMQKKYATTLQTA